jgi:hypothetical protein
MNVTDYQFRNRHKVKKNNSGFIAVLKLTAKVESSIVNITHTLK